MRFVRAGVIAALFIVGGCSEREATAPHVATSAQRSSPATIAFEDVAVPAGPGAAEPFLAATKDGVLLSWLEPVADTNRVALRVARYRAQKWSTPATVTERHDLFVNWADFPSVIQDANGTVFAHWLQKSGPHTYAYDVHMGVSPDGGTTWDKSFLVNRDATKTEHGFVSLAAGAGGGVAVTWLDGRKMKPGDHEHDAGNMTIRYAYVSAGGELSDDVELDDRVCECCNTGMTMTADGPLIVYRDRTADEIRDISYVRRSGGRWTKPQPLARDGWKIAGCPVNGAQADSIGRSVAATWFSAARDRQRVYIAFSDDGGTSFGSPIIVDDGKPAGRVDMVLLDEKNALAVWLEQTAAGAEIRARKVTREGRRDASMKVADSSMARGAGFPRIAKAGSDVWFAWTDQTATRKRIRVARLGL